MTRILLADAAVEDLHSLIRTHRLPNDTIDRVRRSLAPLEAFAELGGELGGSFAGRRFVLGPWRWMIAIYRYDAEQGMVAILGFVDSRTSTSPTANR